TQRTRPLRLALCVLRVLCVVPAQRIFLLRDRVFIELQRELQVTRLVARKFYRIPSGVAGGAIRSPVLVNGAQKSLEAEIGDAVGAEVGPDFLERVCRRDQVS